MHVSSTFVPLLVVNLWYCGSDRKAGQIAHCVNHAVVGALLTVDVVE